jgi:hypothetical protein
MLQPLSPRMTTYSGKTVNPLDLQEDDIDIKDIAHALALENRFGGHSREPISVAQHSIYVSKLAKPEYALQGLLHDASEAYLRDIPKWIKAAPEFAFYRSVEEQVQKVIYRKFGLPLEPSECVERGDRIMVRFEGTRGYHKDWIVGHPAYPPLTQEEIDEVGPWEWWSWSFARYQFLERYRELSGKKH